MTVLRSRLFEREEQRRLEEQLKARGEQKAIEWGMAQAREAGLEQARVTAQPRPLSPFNWMVIVRDGDEVRYSFVNLVRREPLVAGAGAGFIRPLDAAYLPREQARWVHASRFGAAGA